MSATESSYLVTDIIGKLVAVDGQQGYVRAAWVHEGVLMVLVITDREATQRPATEVRYYSARN